jgi:hypothetical protein
MKQNLVVAVILIVVGSILRLSANAIAWPNSYSFNGPREYTLWAIREAAINDIGMGFFYVGGFLFVGILLISFFKNTVRESPNQPSDRSR